MVIRLLDIAGEICKIALPIKYNIFYGKGDSIAVCTLASIDLLLSIASSDLMQKIVLVARLLSENKGIDNIIRYSMYNEKLRCIILCGKDTKGHFAGDALLALMRYGIDKNNRIINAKGKEPILSVDKASIDKFISRVNIINLIGVTEINIVRESISKII